MSYLTPVCGRFHGKFANPRGVSRFPGLASVEKFTAIQQSCSISSPGAWERRDEAALGTKNSLFSPPSNLPTIRVIRARFPSIDAQSRAYPTRASPISLLFTFDNRRVIQIKLLRKLLLYSSVLLSFYAEINSRACQILCSLRGSVDRGCDFSVLNQLELREISTSAFVLSCLTGRSLSQRIPNGRSGDETARSVLTTWSRDTFNRF